MTPLDAKKTDPLHGGASFTLMHRVFRLIWSFVWLIFAAWTPAPLHRWRIFLLRLAGANVHYSAHVYSSARIWYPPNLSMDEFSCIGPRVNCYNMAGVVLGHGAIVSQGAYLCGGTHDINDPNHQLLVKPIHICSGAWVAAEAFVGPGVIIGDDAVVGARAVLFKNAEKNGVYAGNPAQLIRYRYAEK